MKLRHIHLPGLVRYDTASAIQSALVAALHPLSCPPSATIPAHPATILTFQAHPVYTTGRRDSGSPLSATQLQHLSANGLADVRQSLRGGQTTFHGPGQLVAYPILDLKSLHTSTSSRPRLGVREYVELLEAAVAATCARYGVATTTTENPGVWTLPSPSDAPSPPTSTNATTTKRRPDAKICALGLRLRRGVASHGIALNVSTDLSWFDRITACGLPGKSATSLEREGVELLKCGWGVGDVADVFVSELAGRLPGVEGVERRVGWDGTVGGVRVDGIEDETSVV